MADGREFGEWDRMSALLAKLHNCHCKRGHTVTPQQMNPMLEQHGAKQEITAEFNAAMFEALKAAEEKRCCNTT